MTKAESQHEGRFARRSVRLGDAMPELLEAVPAEDRPLAERVLVAEQLEATNDDFAEALETVAPQAFDFLVVGGLVLKETTLEARSALELLTRGDVLAPPLTRMRQVESRAVSRYVAHGKASVAVLDGRFRQAARRWPELSDVLHDQLGRQTHRASMHMAMLHLPRVDERIVALFTDLSERCGYVTADGIVVDVPLTHDVIGRLVGSRRPTVSLALHALQQSDVLSRAEDGAWRLRVPAAYAP